MSNSVDKKAAKGANGYSLRLQPNDILRINQIMEVEGGTKISEVVRKAVNEYYENHNIVSSEKRLTNLKLKIDKALKSNKIILQCIGEVLEIKFDHYCCSINDRGEILISLYVGTTSVFDRFILPEDTVSFSEYNDNLILNLHLN